MTVCNTATSYAPFEPPPDNDNNLQIFFGASFLVYKDRLFENSVLLFEKLISSIFNYALIFKIILLNMNNMLNSCVSIFYII
jgi:hypothetical protein